MTDIYFRVDGNHTIATGHLMRCLSIARACAGLLRKSGAPSNISFLVSDEESLALLEERFDTPSEFPILCLHSNYQDMMAELPRLTALLPDKKCWLFVDSYYATPAYFHALSGFCQVAYLDDLRSFSCDVDLLINYDTDEDCPYYANARKKLLGVRYTPLRRQFQQPAYEVRPQVTDILLSTGGTDPYGMALSLIKTLPQGTYDYHILTSSANSRYRELEDAAHVNDRIHIHQGISDMAALMASCDLAVSAGGTTLCELCAVGVPTISYLMADNQQMAVNTFSQENLIPYAGDIRQDEDVLSRILSFVTCMSQNIDSRKKSSHAMRAFLDGCGAEHIASQLVTA